MLRKRETEIPGSDWMRRCVLFFVVHMYIYIYIYIYITS